MPFFINALWNRFAGLLEGMGAPPDPFRSRPCQGTAWRRAFPESAVQEIREFLHILVECFAFSNRFATRFHPGDELLEIYQALYPSRWTPDALEMESLAAMLASRYGVRLADVWNDQLTLGALFDHARALRG